MRTLSMPNWHIHRCLHDCHALIVWVELLSFPTLQNYSLSLSYKITHEIFTFLSIPFYYITKRFQKCNLCLLLSCVPSSYILARNPLIYTVYMSHSVYTFTITLFLYPRYCKLFRTPSVQHLHFVNYTTECTTSHFY